MHPILLDTCALLWLGEGSGISDAARSAFEEAERTVGVAVSPITSWEIGQLVAKRRIALPMEPLIWFNRALEQGATLAPMPPEVLVAASFLPTTVLRDPADRIIAATARAFGYSVMTRDRPLLAFASEGHMQAITC